MQLSHGWSKDEANKAVDSFGLRKKQKKTGKSEDYHRQRLCPFPGCDMRSSRIDKHLRRNHKLQKSDPLYKRYCTVANRSVVEQMSVPVFMSVIPEVVEKDVEEERLVEEDGIEAVQGDDVFEEGSGVQVDYEWVEGDQEEQENVGVEDWRSGIDMVKSTLDRFLKFMVSPSGGRREKNSAVAYVSCVSKILQVVGGSLPFLFDQLAVRDAFVMDYCSTAKAGGKAYKPNTVRKYLRALYEFYGFTIIEEITIGNIMQERKVLMKESVKAWLATFTKESKERFWEKEEEDEEMIITPEEYKQYERGALARNSRKLLSSFAATHKQPTQREFSACRDHIFVQVHFSNGNRSGVTANMLLKEYNAARQQTDGSWVLKVWKHKTFAHYGTCEVVLTDRTKRWIDVFIEKIRVKTKDEHVFVSWSGKDMQSGAVSRQIHSLWVRSGIFSADKQRPRNISATIIRKSVVNAVRRDATTTTKDHLNVASAMKHSLNTQTNNYRVPQKLEEAKKGTAIIRKAMNFGDEIDTDGEEDDGSVRNDRSVRDDREVVDSPKKTDWSIEDVSLLRDVFKESSAITMELVRSKWETLLARGLTVNDEKKVYDKIRSIRRCVGESSSLATQVYAEIIL